MASDSKIAFAIARFVAGLLAFYAVGSHPYNVYTLTRWIVFLTCCWGVWENRLSIWTSLAPVYGVVALLFNPFFPFYFQRATWRFLDVVVALFLVVSVVVDDRIAKK